MNKYTKIILLICIFSFHTAYPKPEIKVGESEFIYDKSVYNEKTFAGPMGMGLIKSYQLGNDKICIYNTVEGQVIKVYKNLNPDCPKTNK